MQNPDPTEGCWSEEVVGDIGHDISPSLVGLGVVPAVSQSSLPLHMGNPWPSIIIDSSAANTPLRESHVACHMAPIHCASHTTHLNRAPYLAENPRQ